MNYAIESGIIQLDGVREQMRKSQRDKLLKCHPYAIHQSKDKRWRTYLPDNTKKNNRRLITKTHLKDLEECIIEYHLSQDDSERLKNITLEQLYPEWLEYKRKHTRAESYIDRLNNAWKSFYQGTSIIQKPIVKLTKLDMDNWAHDLIKTNDMTKKQYYNVTIIMRQALDYAKDKEVLDTNPLSLVKIDGARLFRKVKKKPSETQVFTKDELVQITSLAWEDFHNKVKKYELSPLAVLFQFETGLRIGELCAISYSDLERPNYIHIQRMLPWHSKEVVDHTKTDYGDREVYLTKKANQLIETARKRQQELGVDSDGYIFSTNGKPLPHGPIADLFKKYCQKIETIHKSPHKARKTYISTLIDGQISINTIREMVGHADERTTYQNYAFDRNTASEREKMLENALNS